MTERDPHDDTDTPPGGPDAWRDVDPNTDSERVDDSPRRAPRTSDEADREGNRERRSKGERPGNHRPR